MKVKATIKVEKEIDHCANQCPFYGIDGGPGPAMYCQHPSIPKDSREAAYIISHPDCDTGFPEKCPLLKGKVLKDYNKYKKSKDELKLKLKKLFDGRRLIERGEIPENCFDCPYCSIDGLPEPIRICSHPYHQTMNDRYIIPDDVAPLNEYKQRIPSKCPLLIK
jgi:hypothetical protein